jgi:hypothetical protein
MPNAGKVESGSQLGTLDSRLAGKDGRQTFTV